MDDRLSPEDRVWFLAQISQYFPRTSAIENDVLRMALPRIVGFRRETIRAVLTEWCIRWGGSNGRFYVGSFLEALAERNETRRKELTRLAMLARADADKLALCEERRAIEEERSQMREAIADTRAADVDRVLEYLRECGWGAPPTTSADTWPPRWVIAVYDLLRDTPWPDVRMPGETLPVREAVRTARPTASGLFR
jgi:hypothetical protein